MKKDEIKKWFKEHESEVKLACKITAGIVIAVVVGKKLKKSFATMEYTPKVETIPKEAPKFVRNLPKEIVDLGFETYDLGERWMEFANYGTDLPELKIDDMHKVIDAIKDVPGFNPEETGIQAMFNIYGLDK
ncbi:MAG: hypothetical protein J6U54_10150 [Clostridiales bacterium]|nr:hypothetical protein [Clostridiales bacterium]